MDRDSIAELHFSDVKNPAHSANNVLLRLLRDGHIMRSNLFVPYVYYSSDSQMKRNSQKINHFLSILNVYKELRRLGKLTAFMVEPKYLPKSQGAEPDIFCQYRGTNFFVEVQRTLYSSKQIKEKLERYVSLFNSGILDPFPHLLILSDQRYDIEGEYPFHIFQAESFTIFLESLKSRNKSVKAIKSDGIKIRVQ
ncbi:hypothetical protein [Cytobacillus stercorigallinarum]|nr:hypothetical protein [Cytobacillus stercorigallinarum]